MRHRRSNIVAGLATALALASGCGGPPSTPTPRPAPGEIIVPPPDPSRLDQVFVLESGGTPPEDTAVTVVRNRRRMIVLRRGAPDNSLFAMITLPDSGGSKPDSTTTQTTAPTGPADSVHVTVKPRPGLYGLDLEVTGGSLAGATISLSYAVHFVAPAGARDRYGGDLLFERALFVAKVEPDGQVIFLPTSRPGSDLVAAVIPGPGRYLVAAPR